MSNLVFIQPTPNPNAIKFIMRFPVKFDGSSNYRSEDEAQGNPMGLALILMNGVTQVYFYDDYITVTKDPTTPWNPLENDIYEKIHELLPEHDPGFVDPKPEKAKVDREDMSPELQQIEAILDATIRPALEMDGGGLEVVGFFEKTLYVKYEGACGACPSATGGTLMAIQNVIKNQFDDEVTVVPVEQ